jgi:hypothetical protein
MSCIVKEAVDLVTGRLRHRIDGFTIGSGILPGAIGMMRAALVLPSAAA